MYFKATNEWKLFDLIKDPKEEKNIFGNQIKDKIVLQEKLTEWINR